MVREKEKIGSTFYFDLNYGCTATIQLLGDGKSLLQICKGEYIYENKIYKTEKGARIALGRFDKGAM